MTVAVEVLAKALQAYDPEPYFPANHWEGEAYYRFYAEAIINSGLSVTVASDDDA